MRFFSWNKLQAKQKISVFALGAVLITYLLYDLLLAPQWAQIDDLTAKYNNEQQQVKVVQNFALAHPDSAQYVAELDKNLLQVSSRFPDNPEISSFLVQIEQLSRECGVQLNYLKPIKTVNKDKEGYREIDVEFSITGTFLQNMNFLHKIENGVRFANITSFTLQLNKKNLDSKILAKVYSYGVPAAAAQPVAGQAKSPDGKK